MSWLQVKHITKSPPHIKDHCYARPSIQQLSDTESDVVEIGSVGPVGGGGGGGDHDYTRARTPPPAPAVKQKVKKLPPARPALPAKQIKWKPREYADKFQIIYKFLTNGVDAEDIMYIKNAYEMVRIEVGVISLDIMSCGCCRC